MKLHSIEGNNASRVSNPGESRMRAFLDGDSNGSELFAALYGHVAREPIPKRFVALIPADQDELLLATS